jgi:hypothetical protein
MGAFAGISEQKSNTESTYLTPGDYTLKVGAVKLVESQRTGSEFFIVEATVLESKGDGAIPANEEVAWVLSMGGLYPESSLKDCKSFVSALTGAHDSDIDEKFVDDLIEEDGKAVVGLEVRCRVTDKATKKGGVFSKHVWRAANK